jgi:inorganic pyrophosphatase
MQAARSLSAREIGGFKDILCTLTEAERQAIPQLYRWHMSCLELPLTTPLADEAMMTKTPPDQNAFATLSAFSKTGDLNAIIDTPKGSRNKFKFDAEHGLFMLSGVLPAGAVFPFDFGYLPSTVGGDGDPLDVLVLMDEPAFVGCLVPSRLIGVIQADQTEGHKTTRNDRLIAVAATSRNHRDIQSLDQINDNLVREIEYFFISYNTVKGKTFTPRGRFGPDRARQVVDEALQQFRKSEA